MKAWKRGLAVVLAAAMCVGSVPGNVSAGNVSDAVGDEVSAQAAEGVSDPSVREAAAAADPETSELGAESAPGASEAGAESAPGASEADEKSAQEISASGAAADAETTAADAAADPETSELGAESAPGASEAGAESAPGASEADEKSAQEISASDVAAQVQPQASGATGSPIEESFITLTEGQELHQTTREKAYYVFAPEETGWYHLKIESKKTGDYFTAGVYQTIYYSGENQETQEKKTYRDTDYKVMNAANSDHAMWLNAKEKYVFHLSISRYTDSSDMDVALTMKKAEVAGLEAVTPPAQPSDFAFVGMGMQVKVSYTDGDSVLDDVKCTITNYTGGGGTVSNALESLRWSGIAVQREDSLSSELELLALDDDRENKEVAGLSEGSHTAILGIRSSVSGGEPSYLECSTSFEVSHNPIESISVIDCTDTYTEGLGQSLGTIILKAVHKDGTEEEVNSGLAYVYQSLPKEEEPGETPGMHYGWTDIDSYLAGGGSLGETTVTVEYQGLTTSYQIQINEYPYDGMSVHPKKTVYYINAGYHDAQHGHSYAGERITQNDLNQISLSRKEGDADQYYAFNNQFMALPYSYQLSYGIELDGKSYTDIDSFISAGGTPGQHTVSVSYKDFHTSYTVEIRQNPYVRMEIAQMPEELSYDYGTARISLDGLVIRAYKNETEYDTYTYGQNAPEGAAVVPWQQYFRCYPALDNSYSLPSGENTVYLTFLNMREEFKVQIGERVNPERPIYIKMDILKAPARTLYYVKENENLDNCLTAEGLELEITDSKGEVKKYKYMDDSGKDGYTSWSEVSPHIRFDWERIDWSAPGTYLVSVFCQETCAEFEVTIADGPVSSFEILRMPETDHYYFYEKKSVTSSNLLLGMAYKITFADGSVHALTLKNDYNYSAFEFQYQGRTYTINRSWVRSTSEGYASPGENAVRFTLFGKQYQTGPITILEDPVESLQVIKEPDKMLYFGESTDVDLYGAKLQIAYQDGTSKEIQIREHGASVMPEDGGKPITAELFEEWMPGSAGGPGYSRKMLRISYYNASAELPAAFTPEAVEATEIQDGGQAKGILDEEHPYQVFSFTPTQEKPYFFYCLKTNYGGFSENSQFYIELNDGENNLFGGYAGSWGLSLNSWNSLQPGHTYYYVVSRNNGMYEKEIPFECYISPEIQNGQDLGTPSLEVLDTAKKDWYEFEFSGSALVSPNLAGTTVKLTYANGWTEEKYITNTAQAMNIEGKNLSVSWKYFDPQTGWQPEIREDNALVYYCGEDKVKEIPVQLKAPNPIASLTIQNNPYEGCYLYQVEAGAPAGLSVTVHFKEEGREDETVEWDGYMSDQKIDGYPVMYDGIFPTGQTGENGGSIYQMKVSCMDVDTELLFEVMPNPVTALELVEPPQKTAIYPFEGTSDIDLYGMEYAVVYRDGTRQNVRISDHGSVLQGPAGSTDEIELSTSQESKEDGSMVTALYLNYKGCKQKMMELEHLSFSTGQAEELWADRTNYVVLGEEGRYRIYRFTSAEDNQYTLNITGNINFSVYRYSEDGVLAETVHASGRKPYSGKMEWDMAAGDMVYLAVKSQEGDNIGCLTASLSGETFEKEEIAELDFTVENPAAGDLFPATEPTFMQGYQVVSSQWYGDEDQDGRADFATAHRLMMILAPEPRYQFTENTKITLNGVEVTNQVLGADGRLTFYYTFPYTECKIKLPEVEGYTLDTGWNAKADRVSHGGTYRFRYLNGENLPDETLSVKANGNVVTLDEENYYTLTDVTENIAVTVRADIGGIDVGEEESRITMYDRSDSAYDIMVGKKEQSIRDNEEGNNTLPLLPSYTDGSEDFFYGWYLDRDAALNGRGTRFTSMTKLKEDAYELFAKWGSGIFYQRVGKRNAVYRVLSFDEYNQMKVEMKGIRRLEIRQASADAVGAADADESGRLEIAASIPQEQMQLQEGLELDIESCTVTAIADDAFAEETGITSVVLPQTIERIGAGAFEGCTDLEEINLPDGITEIGSHAFAGCSSLKKIVLPDTVTEFGEGIFSGCDGLSVVLPDTMGHIDGKAFEGASGVTVVCSSGLGESGILEEIQKAGVAVQVIDLAFAYENGEKIFAYGGEEEALAVQVRINGEATEAAERPLLWQYTETDAYTCRVEGNSLYVTPGRLTTEEDEIWITAVDAETNAKAMLALRTTAADFSEEGPNGEPVYTVEVTGHPVYSGKEQRPAVTVYKKGSRLAASDYETVYENNINAGTGRVTVTGKGNYTGSIRAAFPIAKAAQEVIASDIEKTTDNLLFSLNAKASGGGKLNYTSSNPAVASVDNHGIAIIRGAGTSEIRIWASETENYEASAIKTITLTVKRAGITVPDPSQNPDLNQPSQNQPSGNAPGGSPSQTAGGESGGAGLKTAKTAYTKALGSKPFSLGVTADTKISYTSSNPKVASVNANGSVTLHKCGKAVITAAAGGAKAKITVCVVPNKAAAKAASKKSGRIAVSWTKQKEAAGYVVTYATDRKFKKNAGKKVIKKNNTTSVTLKNLKKGKKYFVQVKAYTLIGGKKAYGTAGKIIRVTVKK